VEDLIVQHFTSVSDAIELQQHKNTHKKVILTVRSSAHIQKT
jgi:hypothetical protein